jgi:hypothetical protein
MARTAEVKRDARIGEAEARKDAQIKEAIAEEERMASRFLNDTEIAKAQRDFELKKAAYDVEVQTKKAEAELAYELQAAKTKQRIKEEQMQIKVLYFLNTILNEIIDNFYRLWSALRKLQFRTRRCSAGSESLKPPSADLPKLRSTVWKNWLRPTATGSFWKPRQKLKPSEFEVKLRLLLSRLRQEPRLSRWPRRQMPGRSTRRQP